MSRATRVKARFATIFEDAIAEFAQDPRYAALDWLKLPVEQLHERLLRGRQEGRSEGLEGRTGHAS
ncbi:MAG: hypothetical protein R2817_05700 [Flavobacteriales bacterium]